MNETQLAKRIQGRVVAITGAARGIGLATAAALHRRGANVVIGDIDESAVLHAAATLGPDVEAVRLDITDEQSFAAFLARAEERFGPLDVLINNAGIMPIGPFLDESTALSKRVLDINVAGPMIGMRAALPGMIARGQGHVVNVASIAGTAPVPGGLSYAASKAAVISMTESARVEFAKSGVSFTCVMPSFTNTELIAGTVGTKFVPTLEPEDVAEAIVRGIVSRTPDMYLPAILGPIVRTQPLIGRRLRDWMNHLLGADTAFLSFDRSARSGYDERITSASARSH
ncbi:SDR family oxidoreductase [Antrihabitans sp. YC2-6]|uniref:SDR family oxidoreductase n=1 Tax=Antrihabitans sp. YC2-6 TaxID=2799498 RepID=UPI0018F51FAE|nr:SDR family oxidoreductase [Antrihabitans sp. YC2-6]MBJ8344349.1 SDR family oxidoreductase [Antrihabitans sp. YC2-6]